MLYPETTGQVEQIVAYSTEHHIPLYVYGGGSSGTRGVEPVKGGISLDMRRNFNKVISFNEIDQTITVQAGMSGPDLEKTLQSAPELFGAKRQYPCGHFPQSFEYSSVGGWTVHVHDGGRGLDRRPRVAPGRARRLVRVPSVRPGRDQPHAQALQRR